MSNEKKNFLVIDSLLFDKNGNLFSIVNSKIKFRVAIDLLNLFHFLNTVEVVESSLDGSNYGISHLLPWGHIIHLEAGDKAKLY